LREYIASVTRPQTYAEPQPIQVACERARQFAANFNLAGDTAAVTDALLDLITQVKIGGRQIHDANIVATMLAYGIPYLWTHNTQDFARFGNQITVIPLVTEESDSEEKSQ
jgi:predicted nucleic acid-binding protein